MSRRDCPVLLTAPCVGDGAISLLDELWGARHQVGANRGALAAGGREGARRANAWSTCAKAAA